MVARTRRNATYFVLFLTVASRLFPEQGQKESVPHVCITETGGTYLPLYS